MTLPTPASRALDDDPDARGARKAASLIVLRDAEPDEQGCSLQVLLLRRAERAGDLRSGVWVFPGGVLDPLDRDLHRLCEGTDDVQASRLLGLPDGGLDYLAAALRECFEEVGLLLTCSGRTPTADERARCTTASDFLALCQQGDLRLDAGALVYFSHWLTPPGVAKRFDTRFFVARAPQHQMARADAAEALEIAWLTPAQALAPERGLKLLPVTQRTLQELSAWPHVQACLDAARARVPPARRMPRLGCDTQGRVRPVPPDHWAWGEIARLDPTGRGDVCIELPPLRPARLSERVQRITCSNGSMMTGPGTNTYLLRPPGSDAVTVLDPGPDDAHTETHLQAVLAAAAPGRIVRILVSHTHKDHSPAARRLQALTGAPVIGRVAAHPQWQDEGFCPDHEPADGERIVLGEHTTLRAIHTPGHASNHVCWLLEEERMLFTGDHVMQGSTVVINPPDGDMAAYLAALQRLQTLPVDVLAPGHGFLMTEPQAELRRLLQHRLAREAKLLAALDAGTPVALARVLPVVYGDVPAARHALAERSLRAHLLKLQAEGRVREHPGDHWEALVRAEPEGS